MKIYQILSGRKIDSSINISECIRVVPLDEYTHSTDVDFFIKKLNIHRKAENENEIRELSEYIMESSPMCFVEYTFDCDLRITDLIGKDVFKDVILRLENAKLYLEAIFSEEYKNLGVFAVIGNDVGYFKPMDLASGMVIDTPEGNLLWPSDTFELIEKDTRTQNLFGLYSDCIREERPWQRIAKGYTFLNSITSKVCVDKYKNNIREGDNSGSDERIRAALGYGYTINYPVFELLYMLQWRFDHIFVAGKIRNSVYHGFEFSEKNLKKNERQYYNLICEYPNIIAFQILVECYMELLKWCCRTGISYSAWMKGKETKKLSRAKNFNPNTFNKDGWGYHVIYEGQSHQVASVLLKKEANKNRLYVASVFSPKGQKPINIMMPWDIDWGFENRCKLEYKIVFAE